VADLIPYPIAELRADLAIRLAVIRVQKRWILTGLAKGGDNYSRALVAELTYGWERMHIMHPAPYNGPGFGANFPKKADGSEG
jgi:hypothetical protein